MKSSCPADGCTERASAQAVLKNLETKYTGLTERIIAAMQEGTGLDMKKTQEVFLTVALFAHGYASIHANNALTYDESLAAAHLERAFIGAVAAVSQEEEAK